MASPLTLLHRSHVATKMEYFEVYTTRKEPDIKIYSTNGFCFKMHKEMFDHTRFQRELLMNTCCLKDDIEIFLPDVTKEVLAQIVQFFYSGTIECDDQDEFSQVVNVLMTTFGFPSDMSFGTAANDKFEPVRT